MKTYTVLAILCFTLATAVRGLSEQSYLLQLKEVTGNQWRELDEAVIGRISGWESHPLTTGRVTGEPSSPQLEEANNATSVSESTPYGIEVAVTVGEHFYIRTVADGFQTVFSGMAGEHPNGNGISLEYMYKRAAVGETSFPMVLSGKTTLAIRKAQPVRHSTNLVHDLTDRLGEGFSLQPGNMHGEKQPALVFNLLPFVPVIGYLDIFSSVQVRLVDEHDEPVADATVAGFYHLNGELVISPDPEPEHQAIRSNENGIIRLGEMRESLPFTTLIFSQEERGLAAMVTLDRNKIHHHREEPPPYVVVMKDGLIEAPQK